MAKPSTKYPRPAEILMALAAANIDHRFITVPNPQQIEQELARLIPDPRIALQVSRLMQESQNGFIQALLHTGNQALQAMGYQETDVTKDAGGVAGRELVEQVGRAMHAAAELKKAEEAAKAPAAKE